MYKQLFPIFLIKSTTMDIEYAQVLWSALLKDKLLFLNDLMEYLEELGDKKPKRIQKDLWNMIL
jgi:hypothetical protein